MDFIIVRRLSTQVVFCTIVLVGAGICLRAQTPSPTPAPAATPPASDIYLVDLKTKHNFKTHSDEITLGDPKKITDFAGYNNQPFFMPDARSLPSTSIRHDRAHIYRHALQTGATTQVTKPPHREYSPTL